MKLYNGDCLEIMKQIPDNSIDLILTDPPYLMNYKTGRRKDKTHKFCSEIANDDNFDLISNYIKECFRIIKNNSAILMFCNCTHIDFFKQELEKYFNVKNIIVWVKNNWSAGDLEHSFGRQYEFLVYASKGQKKINGFRYSDVWEFDRVAGDKLVHQNQKPIPLLERVIKSFTFEGGWYSMGLWVVVQRVSLVRILIGISLVLSWIKNISGLLKKESRMVLFKKK